METQPSADKVAISALNEGKIWRSALLKVIIKRFKERGEMHFETALYSDSRTFDEQIMRGPFFDHGLKFDPYTQAKHGIDSHLIQLEYAYDVIASSYGGCTNQFMHEMIQQDLRDYLFDLSPGYSFSPNSPGFFSKHLSEVLGNK